MTNSRIAASAASKFQRLFSLLLPAALALGAATLPAQQSRLFGHWRGTDRGATLIIAIEPNGHYLQTSQSGMIMAHESGNFRLLGPNRVALSATDSPVKRPKFIYATPAAGGYSPPKRTRFPLGASNTIAFTGPDRIVFTDEKTHLSITMIRIP